MGDGLYPPNVEVGRNYALHTGDAAEVLRTLKEDYFHTCVTSPPYWGLRNYGVEGQLGNEKAPAEYIAKLVAVFREVRRCLREDGTLWIVIGDCYSSGLTRRDNKGGNWKSGQIHTQPSARAPTRRLPVPGMKPKQLIGIPWRLAFALQEDGWGLRSDIIWSKRNCIPESVLDRPTRSHEYVFLLAKSRRYFYDHEAVKEQAHSSDYDKNRMKVGRDRNGGKFFGQPQTRLAVNSRSNIGKRSKVGDGVTRNRRSVWSVALHPYRGAHFATYPPALIEPCILAGSPPEGRVLDPFIGSGTTALVATAHGRWCTGIDLNPEYVAMAAGRLRAAAPAQESFPL